MGVRRFTAEELAELQRFDEMVDEEETIYDDRQQDRFLNTLLFPEKAKRNEKEQVRRTAKANHGTYKTDAAELERRREYYAENRERISALKKEWYHQNRETILARQLQYRLRSGKQKSSEDHYYDHMQNLHKLNDELTALAEKATWTDTDTKERIRIKRKIKACLKKIEKYGRLSGVVTDVALEKLKEDQEALEVQLAPRICKRGRLKMGMLGGVVD